MSAPAPGPAGPGDPARPVPDPSLMYEPPPDGRVDDDYPPPPAAGAYPGPGGQFPPVPGAPVPGAPPYGTGYGSPYPVPGPVRVPSPGASAIVLTVVSALSLLTCWFTLPALPTLTLAIVALARWGRDPGGSARLVRVGWIVYGLGTALMLLLFFVVTDAARV